MSRKGDCRDNAPMESFGARSKMSLFIIGATVSEIRPQEITEYIEIFYNRQ